MTPRDVWRALAPLALPLLALGIALYAGWWTTR